MLNKIKKTTKSIFNSFINWYYESDISTAKKSIEFQPIDKAIYILKDIKERINPKTDAMIKLTKILDIRIKAKSFTPMTLDPRIKEYQTISNI